MKNITKKTLWVSVTLLTFIYSVYSKPISYEDKAAYAIQLAKHIDKLDRSFVGHANHYHATWMKNKPYWAKVYKPTKVIGQHIFYTSK